jgi:CarD family transcriptional regulator
MFKVGDTVLYSNSGVCKIQEISQKTFGESSKDYYVLVPVFNTNSTFFVPTGNKNLVDKMRNVLSAEEIKQKLSCDDFAIEWIDNDRLRNEEFKKLVSCGKFEQTLSLARCICFHSQEISESGKKLHKSDEMVYKDAIKVLFEEMSLYANLEKDDVPDIICRNKSFENLIKNV